jgi:hypothetical protein
MAEKVVDVVLRDRLVASYPVVLNRLNAAISEQDFIGLARDSMRENGYTAEDHSRSKVQRQKCPGTTPRGVLNFRAPWKERRGRHGVASDPRLGHWRRLTAFCCHRGRARRHSWCATDAPRSPAPSMPVRKYYYARR